MCLFPLHDRPKVAKKDIVCYKIVQKSSTKKNEMISMYQKFEYKLNVLYTSDLDIPIIDDNCLVAVINKGIHAYEEKRALNNELIYIRAFIIDALPIKCIIPKGSLYYKGANDEIVSNQMILVEILN